MRFDGRGGRARLVELRFQNVHCPHAAAAGSGVYQDHCLVLVQQSVCQIEPANAKIDDANGFGERMLRQAPDDLDSERIVTEEDVADAGNQNPRGTGLWCGNRGSPLYHSP